MSSKDITKFKIGDQISPLYIDKVSRVSLETYAAASGDFNPIHLDSDYAKQFGLPNIIAHGMLIMSYLGRLLTNTFPQNTLTDFSSQFVSMTHLNDKITCSGRIIRKNTDSHGNIIYSLKLKAVNENGEKRISGKAKVFLRFQKIDLN